MRQSPLLKFIAAIFLVAVLGYIGYNIYDRSVNSVVTSVAYPYTIEECVDTEGKFVRFEHPVSGAGDAEVAVDDGEKVAAGQAVAVRYLSASSMERAATVTALELKIKQLETILGGSYSRSDSRAASSVVALSDVLSRGDFGELEQAILAVNTYVYSDGYGSLSEEELIQELENTEQQLVMLRAASSDDAIYLYTSAPGIFSSVVDGYESINPDTLMTLTPSSFKSIFSISDKTDNQTLGKLIYDINWYYATVMAEEDASRLAVGKSATVRFEKTYSQSLPLTVKYISDAENGEKLVVFSCNRYMSDVCSLRDAYGTLVFATTTGLRVPKAAMHLDDSGKTCVYVISGSLARLINVTILGEVGDYYLVDANEGTLHPGEEIIVRANNLYDGKVVR